MDRNASEDSEQMNSKYERGNKCMRNEDNFFYSRATERNERGNAKSEHTGGERDTVGWA